MTAITNMEPMLTRRSKSTSLDWMLRRLVRSMQAPPAVGSPSPGAPAPSGPEVRPEGHADKVWLPHPLPSEILSDLSRMDLFGAPAATPTAEVSTPNVRSQGFSPKSAAATRPV